MNDKRRQRLLREAIGDVHGTVPDAEGSLRVLAIIAVVMIVMVFSGSLPM